MDYKYGSTTTYPGNKLIIGYGNIIYIKGEN